MDIFKVHEGVIGQYSAHVRCPEDAGPVLPFVKVFRKKISGDDRAWHQVLKAWKAQQAAIDSGELPWEHPDPGPTVVGLASEGAFSQRLKRVQKLSKNPSPAGIGELTVYLAAPENALRWLAAATLSKIGGRQVKAALQALLEKDINDEAREEALKILESVSESN